MISIGSYVDGKYKVLNEIGRGGMSVVYMAINEKVNKTWAIKEVRKDGKMDFNTVRQGLIAEIETLKKLKHPNLPSIVDVIEDEDSFIIVMDYIEGRSLDKIMVEHGAQSEEHVVEWAKQLCDVMGYLHSRTPPIIYRDMKPANIMLKPDGNIMVIDFGTCKTYDVDLGETTGIGTIGYAAPEQYVGSGLGRSDARTDIYCLGVTLYHLLTNDDPCAHYVPVKSIREINPALSYGLDQIILKCCEQDPMDRYQSCADLLYDLQNYERLEPLHKKKQKRKFQAFLAVTLSFLLFLVGGCTCSMIANKKTSVAYENVIYEANKELDYQKRFALYQKGISLPNKAGNKEAYLGLIQACKDNDGIFDQQEANLLMKLIKTNKEALKHKNNYTQICYEVGKLYWYYYQGNNQQNQRFSGAMYSVEWFKEVDEEYEHYAMANAYANIGMFYKDIAKHIVEASDKGKYKEFYEHVNRLLKHVAFQEEENEMVRLELLELARSALHQYATSFKTDGLHKQQLTTMLSQIKTCLNSIHTNAKRSEQLKKETTSLILETQKAIEIAYATNKG